MLVYVKSTVLYTIARRMSSYLHLALNSSWQKDQCMMCMGTYWSQRQIVPIRGGACLRMPSKRLEVNCSNLRYFLPHQMLVTLDGWDCLHLDSHLLQTPLFYFMTTMRWPHHHILFNHLLAYSFPWNSLITSWKRFYMWTISDWILNYIRLHWFSITEFYVWIALLFHSFWTKKYTWRELQCMSQ